MQSVLSIQSEKNDRCLNCRFPASGSAADARKWDVNKRYYTPTEPTILEGGAHIPSLYCPSCHQLMYRFDKECPHCNHVLTAKEHKLQTEKSVFENFKGIVYGVIFFPSAFILFLWLFS